MRDIRILDITRLLESVNREATESCDVRLQVFDDGRWLFHSGDIRHDILERPGYWGYSTVPGNNSACDFVEIAEDLLEQVEEDQSICKDLNSINFSEICQEYVDTCDNPRISKDIK